MNNRATLPILMGDKVFLRPIEPADVDGPYLDWLNDPEVTRYLEVRHTHQTRETLTEYLSRFENSDTDFIFAICVRSSNQHIGNATINHINKVHGTADTGIMIGAKEYWGKGYGFEAWSHLLAHAFTNMDIRKIVAGAITDNVASIRLQEKLGFKVEGTFRDEVLIDGKYRDTVRLCLFSEDFQRE